MRGPDKKGFTNQSDFEFFVERDKAMAPEEQADHDLAQDVAKIRGGCLLRSLEGRELDSGSPMNCGNDDCGAFRTDSTTKVIQDGSNCLVPSKSVSYL